MNPEFSTLPPPPQPNPTQPIEFETVVRAGLAKQAQDSQKLVKEIRY